MKFLPNSVKNMKTYEIVLLVCFIIYIIFPIQTPTSISKIVESPLGIVILFCITVSLFIYTNPILGVVYILVAYELLRRSSDSNMTSMYNVSTTDSQKPPSEPTRTTRTIPITQTSKDAQLQSMNTISDNPSLEEDIIRVSIPSNQNHSKVVEVENNFLPVADNVITGSSMYV
jgi:hypothetical protein